MSLSEIALQGNSFLSVLIREREIHFCSPANPVTIRQSGIREGKARILTDGLLKVTRRPVNGFRVPLAEAEYLGKRAVRFWPKGEDRSAPRSTEPCFGRGSPTAYRAFHDRFDI